jgi:PIN domain nuclease of toxin-antitoxin system
MNEVVLDASALLALLREEPGGKIVEAYLTKSIISTVNLSEVVAQLIKYKMPTELATKVVSDLGLRTVPFNEEMAYSAASLMPTTNRLGLSFGDRACLALALSRKLSVLTTDRIWAKLNIACDIKLVR